MRRGEMYYITTTGAERGSEMKAEYARAGLVVSNDRCNAYSPVVEIVWLTTREKKPLPTHVKIKSARYPSTAMCEQIHSVDKERVGDYIGTATEDEMREIDRALAVSIGLQGAQDMGAENKKAAPQRGGAAVILRPCISLQCRRCFRSKRPSCSPGRHPDIRRSTQ